MHIKVKTLHFFYANKLKIVQNQEKSLWWIRKVKFRLQSQCNAVNNLHFREEKIFLGFNIFVLACWWCTFGTSFFGCTTNNEIFMFIVFTVFSTINYIVIWFCSMTTYNLSINNFYLNINLSVAFLYVDVTVCNP